MKRKIAIGTQEKEIDFLRQGDQIRVTIDGKVRRLTVLRRDGALIVVDYEDHRGVRQLLHLAGSARGAERHLWVNGQTLTYSLVGRQPAASSSGSLGTDIPAVVSDVLVQEADTVAAGDVLILLESMKMVIPIKAPYAGTVTDVHCRKGEAVQPGADLVSLRPAATSAAGED